MLQQVEQDRFTVKPFSLRRSVGDLETAKSVFPPPTRRRSSHMFMDGHVLAPVATSLLSKNSMLRYCQMIGS